MHFSCCFLLHLEYRMVANQTNMYTASLPHVVFPIAFQYLVSSVIHEIFSVSNVKNIYVMSIKMLRGKFLDTASNCITMHDS